MEGEDAPRCALTPLNIFQLSEAGDILLWDPAVDEAHRCVCPRIEDVLPTHLKVSQVGGKLMWCCRMQVGHREVVSARA